jgi:phosphatidylglycerophosphate synthase
MKSPEQMSKPRRFMYDHGRTIADSSSWMRLGLGVVSATALLADKPKVAKGAHLLGVVTDKVDGWAAGLSKEGPTAKGGKLDQQIDKVFTAVTEAAMVAKGRLKERRVYIRTGRDLLMANVVRPHYEEQGIDTSAAPIGKNATAVVVFADCLSMTDFGQNHPKITERIHDIGDGLKIYSMFDAPRYWKRRHEAKKLNRNVANQSKEESAA